MQFLKCFSLMLFIAALLVAGCRPEVVTPVKQLAQPEVEETSTSAEAVAEDATPKPVAEPKPGASTTKSPPATVAPIPAPKLSLPALLKNERIYFRTADGGKHFQIKPKEADAVKFYDAAGTELCKLTMHPDKLKVKTADEKPLFELKWHGDKVSFKDGVTEKELSKLRFHGPDFEFVVGETTKAKIVHEAAGGYRVEDADGKKLGTLSTANNHAQFSNADGNVSLKCEQTASPQALIGFALPELTPEQQAALFIYMVSLPVKQ